MFLVELMSLVELPVSLAEMVVKHMRTGGVPKSTDTLRVPAIDTQNKLLQWNRVQVKSDRVFVWLEYCRLGAYEVLHEVYVHFGSGRGPVAVGVLVFHLASCFGSETQKI